jgi:hypothetical protein
MDIIIPLPNLSCSTVSPSANREESLALNGTPDEALDLLIFLNLSSFA